MIKGKNVRSLHFIMIIIYHHDKIGRVGEFDNKKIFLNQNFHFAFHFPILKFYFLNFNLFQKGVYGIIRIQYRKEGSRCILSVIVS